MSEACKDCRFFVEAPMVGQHVYGHCHRFPPSKSSDVSGHPPVGLSEWCGEFKATPIPIVTVVSKLPSKPKHKRVRKSPA